MHAKVHTLLAWLAGLTVVLLAGGFGYGIGRTELPDGVEMNAQERAACAAEGCGVWTNEELKALMLKGYAMGFKRARMEADSTI